VPGFVGDQNAGRRGVFVDFFGAPASTARGAGLFAVRGGAALFSGAALRRDPGTPARYLVHIEEIEVPRTGDAEDDVRRTTAYVGVGPGNTAPYVTSTISGNRDVESEELLAFEFGYRVRPIEDMTVSIATFFNEYDELLSTAGGLNPVFGNVGDATTFGVEVSGTWQVTPRWRVTGSYSFLNQDFRGPFDEETDATSVQHMGQVRSEYDLTKDLELNAAFYVVDTPFGRAAPLYGRLDLGLTWRPQDNLELSVHGQNLLDPSHPEWVDPFFQGTVGEVPRAVYFRASMRF